MDVKKFEKIEKSFTKDGIQALADRPNANNQYGVSGLSAQQLKARFDAMPEEIKLKVNAVIDGLYSDGGEYIPFSLDDTHKTVYDLLTAIGDGTLAKYLKSAAGEGVYKTLEDIAASAVLSAALLGGHSVKKDVPENAEFTDTVYDDSALSGRIKEIEDKEKTWDAKQDAIPENTYDAYGSSEAVREAVKKDLDGKLDKSLPNDPYNYIYGCNITGTFKRELVNTPKPYGVPTYDPNGRIKANAPSVGNDAANKEYVDEMTSPLEYRLLTNITVEAPSQSLEYALPQSTANDIGISIEFPENTGDTTDFLRITCIGENNKTFFNRSDNAYSNVSAHTIHYTFTRAGMVWIPYEYVQQSNGGISKGTSSQLTYYSAVSGGNFTYVDRINKISIARYSTTGNASPVIETGTKIHIYAVCKEAK